MDAENNRNATQKLKILPYCWKPGQSGNPGGRPKSRLLTYQLERLLKQKDPKTGKRNAELVAAALIKELAKGRNVKELFDRLEGPVVASADEELSARTVSAVERVLDRLDGDGAPQPETATDLE